MAAGFLISRILLLYILSDVHHTFAFPTANLGHHKAWQDGGRTHVHGYGNRRPLHYVRSLRQQNPNLQPVQLRTWQPPQRLRDRNPAQTQRQIMRPRAPQQIFHAHSTPQIKYPLARPKALQINVDLPFDFKDQNKRTDSVNKGYDYEKYRTEPKQWPSGIQIQSGFNVPKLNPEKASTKDQYEGTSTDPFQSSIQFNFSIPFSAASLKPLKSNAYVERPKLPLKIYVHNEYMEPGKRELNVKWPTSGQSTQEKIKGQIGSKWPVFNQPKIGHQLQQTSEPVHPQRSDKPIFSWQSGQQKSPQLVSQEKKPTRHRWGFQRPEGSKPSLPILKYLDNLDFHRPHTTPSKKDDEIIFLKPDVSKLYFSSPVQFESDPNRALKTQTGAEPSKVHFQSGFGNPATDAFKGLTKEQKREDDHEFSSPTLELGITFPILTELTNITQSNGEYVVNIKPGFAGSFKGPPNPPSEPQQTGSKWPIINFEMHQKPYEQSEKKWPQLNLGTIFQPAKQPHEPVHTQSTDVKPAYSSWHSSPQVGQDKQPTGQSWGHQVLDMNKPQSLVSKYLDLVGEHLSKDDEDQTVQPENVPSSFYSSWVKPSSDVYSTGKTGQSGDWFTSPSKQDNQLTQPIGHTQNVEMEYHSSPNYNFPSVDSSKMDAALTYEATKPQKWQNTFPQLYQYNSGQEASETLQSPQPQSSWSQTQNWLGQDMDGHSWDGKGNYEKLFGTDDSLAGQTSFLTETQDEYGQKWSGKDSVGTDLNLQSPPCSSQQDLFTSQFNSPHLKKPWSGAKKCTKTPEESYEESYNQLSYSPNAEITAVAVPSNAFHPVSSGSVSNPFQNMFHHKRSR